MKKNKKLWPNLIKCKRDMILHIQLIMGKLITCWFIIVFIKISEIISYVVFVFTFLSFSLYESIKEDILLNKAGRINERFDSATLFNKDVNSFLN